MRPNWNYYGVFLTKESRQTLLKIFKSLIPEGWTWEPYAHHMTIIYNNGSAEAQTMADRCEASLNNSVTLDVTDWGISDKALAVKVKGYMSNNANPHITIAVAPGAKPVDSNKISEWTPMTASLKVNGIVSVFEKRK